MSKFLVCPASMQPAFSLSLQQQHTLARLPPEQKNAYLFRLQAKQTHPSPSKLEHIQYNGMASITPPLATIQEHMQPPKRRRGGGPRKCGNPSCDRVVTKRNFCYKCQKRKERGLPMGPLLPSVSHVLQNSNAMEITEEHKLAPLVNHGISPQTTKTLQTITSAPKPTDNADKLEQLHSYLLNLAGSEEKANSLVQDYLKQHSPTVPRANFAQQTQTPEQFTRFY